MSLLEIIELSKSFKNIKAVDEISFSLAKGEILGLLGPNGAGKSTAISMIATLLKPDKGRIVYKNEDISLKPKKIQKDLGFVPQDIALYPSLSGMDNLKFWGRAYGLKGIELKDNINRVSEIIGIDKRLNDRVDKYSGGMKRRLNIGAALLHNPELIIMDEPTVGIDPQSRSYILKTVKELRDLGSTIIYTSHYMEEVENICTRICIMDNGKIINQGTREELLQSIGAKEQIKVQFEKLPPNLELLLEGINHISNIKVSEATLTLNNSNGNTTRQELMKTLLANTSNIISFDIKEPDLEYVFLNLTGKELRD